MERRSFQPPTWMPASRTKRTPSPPKVGSGSTCPITWCRQTWDTWGTWIIQVSLEKKCVSLVEVLQLDASTSTPSLKVYLYKLGTITLRNIQRCKACGANQWYFGSSSPPLLARGFQSSVVSSCLHLSLCSRVTQRFTFFATTSSSQGGVRLVTNLEKNSTGIKLKLSSSYRSWLLSLSASLDPDDMAPRWYKW